MSPFFCIQELLDIFKKTLTHFHGDSVLISFPFEKIKFVSISLMYFFIPLNPLIAFEFRDYLLIDKLVTSCYKDKRSCNEALLKIHNYQKNAAINKKFACQTRLLGLEANLIMAKKF